MWSFGFRHIMGIAKGIDDAWLRSQLCKPAEQAVQRRSSRPPNPPIGGGPGQLWGPKLV